MKAWKMSWKDRMHKMWIREEQRSYVPGQFFQSKLSNMLQELVNEEQSNDKIKVWFEVIPSKYWSSTNENQLHVAARVNSARIVGYLIDGGCHEINQKNHSSETPLALATRLGNTEVVKVLLDAGAMYKIGLLHIAVEKCYTDIIKLLIDAGADVNAIDDNGCRPLDILSRLLVTTKKHNNQQLTDIAKFLIEAGSNVDAVVSVADAPLYLAMKHQYFNIAHALVDAGANVNVPQVEEDSGKETPPFKVLLVGANSRKGNPLFQGLTCLQMAVVSKDKELVLKFLEHGADVHTRSYNGHSTLYIASGTDDYSTIDHASGTGHRDMTDEKCETIRILLERGAGLSLNHMELFEILCNILLFANEEILHLFIATSGIDLSDYGEIFFQMFKNLLENETHGHRLLKILLNHGNFDLNARGRNGLSIQRAILANDIRCVKILLKRGAKVNPSTNILSERDETPLELACDKSYDFVKLLLEYNADINLGRTLPLQIVVERSFGGLYDSHREVEDSCSLIVKYIALAEVQGRKITEENHRIIRAHMELQQLYERCKKNLIVLSERHISDSITFLDVFLDTEQYSRNRYVIEAFEAPEEETNFNDFGEFRDMLIERFERARKRPKLIQEAERGLMCLFGTDFKSLIVISEFILRYLSNKDLRGLIRLESEISSTQFNHGWITL